MTLHKGSIAQAPKSSESFQDVQLKIWTLQVPHAKSPRIIILPLAARLMSGLVMLTLAASEAGDRAVTCCSLRRPMLEAEMKVQGEVELVVTSCHGRRFRIPGESQSQWATSPLNDNLTIQLIALNFRPCQEGRTELAMLPAPEVVNVATGWNSNIAITSEVVIAAAHNFAAQLLRS